MFRKVCNAAVIQGFCDVLGFFESLFTMYEPGNFFCQTALGQTFFRFLFHGFRQSIDFFLAEECKVFEVLDDIGIVLIKPELIEFKGRCLFRIKPDSSACGLAELCAIRFEHERNRQCIYRCIAAMHLADHIDTARNIAPLIRTANLELYVIFAVQMFIIDSLENLIGKFRKRNTCFQTAGYDFFCEHDINWE